MGLLFVLEGDEAAEGLFVDLDMGTHASIMTLVHESDEKLFPLIRRLNRFYNDVLYEADELDSLIEELIALKAIQETASIDSIIRMCRKANSQGIGVETISD